MRKIERRRRNTNSGRKTEETKANRQIGVYDVRDKLKGIRRKAGKRKEFEGRRKRKEGKGGGVGEEKKRRLVKDIEENK